MTRELRATTARIEVVLTCWALPGRHSSMRTVADEKRAAVCIMLLSHVACRERIEARAEP